MFRLLIIPIVIILLVSCKCTDKYIFDFTEVDSVRVYDLKNQNNKEIINKETLIYLNTLLNNNCYERNIKQKIVPTFKILLTINKQENITIYTNGNFFDIYLKEKALGQYKLKENINAYLKATFD